MFLYSWPVLYLNYELKRIAFDENNNYNDQQGNYYISWNLSVKNTCAMSCSLEKCCRPL